VIAEELVSQIARLKPELGPVEHLRLALLAAQQAESLDELADGNALREVCDAVSLKLDAASDQHRAVAFELDSLATTAPCDFSTDHLWTLVRAIKVQSQVLNLYLADSQRQQHV